VYGGVCSGGHVLSEKKKKIGGEIKLGGGAKKRFPAPPPLPPS